ncbi:putative bifunctional diguanylate cyclase/phosphodiesterase [Thiomicrorhabdus sediminis]|uniref:Bifunctional diguanylate cyclase/phosphodiesterase n=1 Tax=Thiomicrorhabdus sediminis TaxID=2580412 RepID=A0A4P9K4W3_9GAMM|nr:bifunctional diguanylate cyclase/phosphodiesterase [Thiomicrorhabdus sediminis]QCU89791.1 bifunctional diguanylate cyclase/phosphodiesterase [Thiomicrorhabdus sediminis]
MSTSQKKLPSLRKRYVLLNIVIGLLVIAAITAAYFKALNTKNTVNRGYEGVLNEQANLKEVRDYLLHINGDINHFLLDPLNQHLTQNIDIYTSESIDSLNQLNESTHPYHVDLANTVNPIKLNFEKLNKEIKRLIEYRLDINKQYPAMDISANIMEVQQDNIKSGFEILILEIESESLKPTNEELYPLLLKTRTLWSEAISQTRIYMVNRLASFTTEILQQQGSSLADMYELFKKNLNQLEKFYAEEDSFEGLPTVKSIHKISEDWIDNFLQMRNLSENNQWRSDAMIMQNDILPLITNITILCNQLEKVLRDEKQNLDNQLSKSDAFFNYLIYGIISLYLIIISFILLSMEWAIFKPIDRVTQALRSRALEVTLPKIKPAKTKEMARLIEAFVEMDNEVSARQNELEHQALHDHLTGLPNRFSLNQRIEYQLLSSERQHSTFSLFIMDLDYFKDINDTLGHASGDSLLIEVSKRVKRLIRKSDTLARLGGDEFSILLPDTNKEEAAFLAEKIIEDIAHPFNLNGEKVSISISIGIAGFPHDGLNAETILQCADMAMYASKRKRTGYSLYNANQNVYSKDRLILVNDLLEALELEQFEINFQPKINLETGSICGAEALLRFIHKNHGYVPPDKVIETAERMGVIHRLSLQILKKSIAECSKWHRQGYPISVSVNLSVRDLASTGLCSKVKEFMEEFNLNYEFLTLEITENVMMENLSLSIDQLNKLNKLGVKISIDDFGTGFSSLAYLKRLPVQELKIDKSFVIDIEQDENDQQIVRSTIDLGHSLGLTTVAEGVETLTAMEIVKSYGCDQVQGYYFSKPVNPEEFRRLLSMQ